MRVLYFRPCLEPATLFARPVVYTTLWEPSMFFFHAGNGPNNSISFIDIAGFRNYS